MNVEQIRAEYIDHMGSDLMVVNAAARLEIESLKAQLVERAKERADELTVAYMCGASREKELAAQQPGAAYAALPEPLEIDWPELHSQALGCGVEDRDLHNRYECAEYGWQDGVDKCAERVPEQIFDADQMLAFADATCALRPSNGQAPAGANENAELVTLIAKCRDAFPIPAHGDPIENYWSAAIEDPAHVAAEAAKAEALREKIRAEEQAKAQREADARAAETVRAAAEAMALEQAERERVAAAARASEMEARRQEQAREFEEQERREIARLAAANSQLVHHVETPLVEMNPAAPVQAANVFAISNVASACDRTAAFPTLKLGDIAERLGFSLSADFLANLGFEATRVKNACLYQERDWPLILMRLAAHIQHVQGAQAA